MIFVFYKAGNKPYLYVSLDFFFENGKLTRMDNQPLTAQAIKAALEGDWKKAIKINTQILKEDPNDLTTLNRIGYAYLNLGKKTKAKKLFNQVISLDQYNSIALKNLAKLKELKSNKKSTIPKSSNSLKSYIEEPGITKVVPCVNIASADVVANVSSGQEVYLHSKKRCVEVRNEDKVYLGALPDDTSFHISKLIKGGNTYKVYIKSVGKNSLSVLIREISRGKKFEKQPSFIKQKKLRSKTRKK